MYKVVQIVYDGSMRGNRPPWKGTKMNTITTQEMRQKFERNIHNWARDLTTREFTGTKAWLIGIEIINIARSYDISDLSEEFLDNQLKLHKSWLYLDGHNVGRFDYAVTNTMIQIIEALKARKVGA
jgi:hypothetical protein